MKRGRGQTLNESIIVIIAAAELCRNDQGEGQSSYSFLLSTSMPLCSAEVAHQIPSWNRLLNTSMLPNGQLC